MPFVTKLRSTTAEMIGKIPAKLLGLASHGFMADDDPARGQQILDHTQAQWKPEVKPHGL
jgi:hypothetical protein